MKTLYLCELSINVYSDYLVVLLDMYIMYMGISAVHE